ncbi:sensor histidine kinase [Vagococcus vulneris]|uniref:histidine kinase n=1 Tax=Vagococcus vulneris TaxID=1977869 RepID=A0A429ZUE9_9ENTE|nr:HAMP domain-containing sensor histidine kinase [Vagococcus vulneris]RST97361.1 hypothetical protein CBF37_09775 [Vagococcus vulneris]
MKKKIVYRLTASFSFILITFSLISLITFFIIYNRQTATIQFKQMTEQGQMLADKLIEDYNQSDIQAGRQMRHQQSNGWGHMTAYNYQTLVSFMNQLTTTSVWIVDDTGKALFDNSQMMMRHQKIETFSNLPKQLNPILKEATVTKNNVEKKNNSLLQTGKQQLAIPLIDNHQQIFGVIVLEQAPIIKSNLHSGDFVSLINSFLVALLLTIILATLTAKRFVKPIYHMADYTEQLIKEDYAGTLIISTEDELNLLADKLNRLTQRLAQAKQEQDNREASQKQFLSQISHELRTPVMIIKNTLETLSEQSDLSTTNQQQVHSLLLESQQLTILLNDLLELSRLQSSEFTINQEIIDISAVISDSLRSYRPLFNNAERYLNVTYIRPQSSDFAVLGDYMRLTQLLKILLSNSLKYSLIGSQTEITIGHNQQYFQLTITNLVEHTLSQKEAEQLFHHFKRGNNPDISGHGLGLAIAKQIVERHHGSINILSENQKFSVLITLPLYS